MKFTVTIHPCSVEGLTSLPQALANALVAADKISPFANMDKLKRWITTALGSPRLKVVHDKDDQPVRLFFRNQLMITIETAEPK